MFNELLKKLSFLCLLAVVPVLIGSFAGEAQSAEGASKEKVKVLYHVDGKDPEVAKYAGVARFGMLTGPPVVEPNSKVPVLL